MSDSRRLATSMVASWGANIVKAVVQIVMLPIMARFLGPTEMGLYALALPIVGLAMPLADAGLANSLAREKSENRAVWSTAFWMLQGIGIVLALAVILGAHLVAYTAHQPRLPLIIAALSVIFPMLALSVLPMARVLQKGRLIAPAMIDMTSNVLGAGLGIWFAFAHFGVWAMVIQYSSVFFFRAVLYNFTEFFLPRFMFSLHGLAGHLQMGGSVTGSRLAEFAGRVVENSVVSRSLGGVALGSYGFATQASRFLSEAVSNSLWANLYYTSLHSEPAVSAASLLKLTRLMALILLPASFLAAGLAPTALPILLGEKWVLAGWPFAILCFTAPFTVMASLTSAVLYARGMGRLPVILSVGTTLARVGAIVIFCTFGLNAACIAIATVCVAQFLVSFVVTQDKIGHSATTVFRYIFWPLSMSIAGFLVVLSLLMYKVDIYQITIACVMFGTIYIGGQALFDRKLFHKDAGAVAKLLKSKYGQKS